MASRIPLKELLGFPYLVPPEIPDAFDDEFDDGDPDLLVRGWTVINQAGGGALTRAGNTDTWGPAPAAGTYQSNLKNGSILVRGPSAVELCIVKTIVLAAGDTFFARLGGGYSVAPAADGRWTEVGVYGFAAGTLDLNNRSFTSFFNVAASGLISMGTTSFVGGVANGPAAKAQAGFDILGVHYDGATTLRHFYLSSSGGQHEGGLSVSPAAGLLVRFAIRHLFTYGEGSAPLLTIDFIRRKTLNNWLIT